MSKIIGNTTATPNPQPDWNQTEENKADFIKNKIPFENGVGENSIQQNGCAATGDNTIALGNGTIATSSSQHVQGKFNVEDTSKKYAHIVGNGTNVDNRSNAHTIDWNGNAWFAGSLTLGSITLSEKKLKAILSLVVGKTISGVYTFGVHAIDGEISDITFTSNGETFNRMQIISKRDETVGHMTEIYYDNKRVAEFNEDALMWSFVDDRYSTIDFGEEGQELLSSEYEWFITIASKPKITFTLNGFTVEAEGGTLWGNFIYDDGTSCVTVRDGYAVLDAYGTSGFCYYIIDESDGRVLTTDEIRSGGVYRKGAMIV